MSNNVFHSPLHTDQKTKMDASRQTFVVLALEVWNTNLI